MFHLMETRGSIYAAKPVLLDRCFWKPNYKSDYFLTPKECLFPFRRLEMTVCLTSTL